MGYTSRIVVAVTKSYKVTCLLDNNWPSLLSDSYLQKSTDTLQIFDVPYIKWFREYPDAAELMDFLEYYECEAEEYGELGAIRLGEVDNDSEVFGEPGEFGIEYVRTIKY